MQFAAFRRRCGMVPRVFYPTESALAGEHGTVIVEILIGLNGDIDRTEIVQSSGSPRLDQAAIDGVRYLKCRPEIIDGKPARAVVRTPVSFDLNK